MVMFSDVLLRPNFARTISFVSCCVLVMLFATAACGGTAQTRGRQSIPKDGVRVATIFFHAIASGHPRRALAMLDDADYAADGVNSVARSAKREHLTATSIKDLGGGHIRFWVHGKERRPTDGALISAKGHFDVFVDRSRPGKVSDWEYLPKVTFFIP
jgi:hypothetical protein